ncbi:MAG: hypothetical protein HC814_00310 [Rhodobacteraceae bacterium]|nr:hypothetical protein [Paracoccaceae bacterium]
MTFDLANIRKQIEQAPLSAPLHLELGIAAVCDVWRLANLAPADDKRWRHWTRGSWPNFATTYTYRDTTFPKPDGVTLEGGNKVAGSSFGALRKCSANP